MKMNNVVVALALAFPSSSQLVTMNDSSGGRRTGGGVQGDARRPGGLLGGVPLYAFAEYSATSTVSRRRDFMRLW